MSVLDASMMGASHDPREPGYEASRAFLASAAAQRLPLRAPSILLPELASALLRQGTARVSIAATVAAATTRANVRVLPVTLALAIRAAELVADLGPRGCDAIYVALAESLNDELVTLDGDQLDRALQVISARRP